MEWLTSPLPFITPSRTSTIFIISSSSIPTAFAKSSAWGVSTNTDFCTNVCVYGLFNFDVCDLWSNKKEEVNGTRDSNGHFIHSSHLLEVIPSLWTEYLNITYYCEIKARINQPSSHLLISYLHEEIGTVSSDYCIEECRRLFNWRTSCWRELTFRFNNDLCPSIHSNLPSIHGIPFNASLPSLSISFLLWVRNGESTSIPPLCTLRRLFHNSRPI